MEPNRNLPNYKICRTGRLFSTQYFLCLVDKAFNRYLTLQNDARNFITSLASGNLEVPLPPRNQIAAPYKQLHASLQHITWQTKQIAQGDFNQRVNFMGEFSDAFNSMVEALAEKERTEIALHEARNHVRYLEGIIPICMYCKKIRDDKDSWQQMETYISEHSDALFSHGICPACLKIRLSELSFDIKKQ